MIVNKEKVIYKEIRLSILELMAYCLRKFKATGDERWNEEGKWFGQQSKEIKKLSD